MRLNLKQRLLTIITSIAVGVILIAVFIIVPSIKHILNLHDDIANTQKMLEERYVKFQKLKKSAVQLKDIKQTVEDYAQSTISTADQLKIITEIEKLATENHIDQSLNVELITTPKNNAEPNPEEGPNITTEKTKKRSFSNYYHFSFLNNGLFSDQIKYLRALEKLPYYVIIDNWQWEKRKNENNTNSPVTLRFEGIIYVSL